jgi:cysteinyl-tRNA synthetase
LALTELHALAKSMEMRQRNDVSQKEVDDFAASARLLGLLEDNAVMGSWVVNGAVEELAAKILLDSLLSQFTALRLAAMASKDFSAVDALKSALIAAGVEVRMSKAGVELVPGPGFDPAKLETLQ